MADLPVIAHVSSIDPPMMHPFGRIQELQSQQKKNQNACRRQFTAENNNNTFFLRLCLAMTIRDKPGLRKDFQRIFVIESIRLAGI